MKEILKRAAIDMLSRSPFLTAIRARALRGNPTTILCYHTLRPAAENIDAWTVLAVEDFRDQIRFLRAHYDIVSLADALKRQGQSGRPRVVLTFDDGEWGLFQHLLPIVEEEQIPVTVYIATRQIESGTPYWFDRVMNALQLRTATTITLDIAGQSQWHIGAASGNARWTQISDILEAIKSEPEAKRDQLADAIVAQAGPKSNAFTPLKPMTVDQLRTLATHPLVTIGAHSHGHELLDKLPLDVASESINLSKTWLEDTIGEPVDHFAYPNGNHTPELSAEVARLGLKTATILEEKLADQSADLFALPRIGIGRFDKLSRMKLRLLEI